MRFDICEEIIPYGETVELYNKILKRNFTYGETDTAMTPPTGVVSELSVDDPIFIKLNDAVLARWPELKSLNLQRAYINLFHPNEQPYFHSDGDCITCLFYINPTRNLQEGGETQFLVDDNILGVLPRAGCCVVFDGRIMHRATSFRSVERITVAIKYNC